MLELTAAEDVGFVEDAFEELEEVSSSSSSQSSGMVPVCSVFELVLVLVLLLEVEEGFLLPVELLVPMTAWSSSVPITSEPVCSITEDALEIVEDAGSSFSLFFFLPQPEREHTAKSAQSVKQSAVYKNFLFIKVTI